ncbi:MAG: hypothetical protein CL811_12825 [Colwelliaceae bacterium]|nr:hypothetical protein [Colwelliaceae bacterium]|tara:strand:- start:890 stop:1348 length:459 start_codon:yes stop_codon:yes gene_type:complete
MNLGEALSLLKQEKSRLSRIISIRKENVFLEKGKKTVFDPKDLGKKIDEKISEIRRLKIKIQKTNLQTKIENEDLTIAEAIIKIGDIRSKLANLRNLFEKRGHFYYREREEKEMIPQLDEKDVENEIEELEKEKTLLDNGLQVANWKTELIS